MIINPVIFKDYDIRAVMDKDLDVDGVRRIAQGLYQIYKPQTVAIGYDMRLSSPGVYKALVDGFTGLVDNIWNLGLISTDMSYFVGGKYPQADLIIMITASHNPPEYNGMKITQKGAIPVGGKTGLYKLRDIVTDLNQPLPTGTKQTQITNKDIWTDWIKANLSIVDSSNIKPFKIVIDAGNGMAGHFIPKFNQYLPNLEIIPLFFDLDGSFPNHIPNPLLPEAIEAVKQKVRQEKADLGVIFDGDGDRMFIMDETGRLLSGTQTTALLAEHLLDKYPGGLILYNIVTGRIIPEVIKAKNGQGQITPVGHSNIKRIMRETGAVFGGEHSGHYFYRDLYYADNAILSLLLALEYASLHKLKFSQIYDKYNKYPQSGEINFEVDDKQAVIKKVKDHFGSSASQILDFDGIRLDYDDYWFNIRPSNTEPLLRLNMEANDQELLQKHLEEVVSFLESLGAQRA
ncbi:MAG: phosphomannomutase/phosphoglucomutase [bacterium]|nr:phosphomannomutase/phosphoglucomutase [bacterium]